MPRSARIDVPGKLYHVMARGIERRELFQDEEDYCDFRERLSVWLERSGAKCLAWCLMPNHFHFLILRGERPLSGMMHHIMTGYAINFNLRHRRVGHLFQNRYKSIICDLGEYLFELVPYIHLNPLRAGLVSDLTELAGYKWCGHGAALGDAPDEILDRGELLAHYGEDTGTALEKYMRAISERAAADEKRDLSGGGLLRSFGGTDIAISALRAGQKIFSDQRILGGSDFVESVLRFADEELKNMPKSRAELLAEVEVLTGISRQDVLRRTRERGPAQARAVYCCLCKNAGHAGHDVAQELGLSDSAVCRLAAKGRGLMESEIRRVPEIVK